MNPWLNEDTKKIKCVLRTVKESEQLHEDDPAPKTSNCDKCDSYRDWGVRTDVISRKIFPGFFLTFAIIYWIYYLHLYNSNT